MINAVKTVATFAKEEVLSAVNDFRVKELVKKTQSSKRTERILAKAKLKKFYPNIWDVLEE